MPKDKKAFLTRAQDIGDRKVPAGEIVIEALTPNFDDQVEAARHYKRDAEDLCEVLFKCLPGGTLDAILIEFLQRKHSLFCVNPTDYELWQQSRINKFIDGLKSKTSK